MPQNLLVTSYITPNMWLITCLDLISSGISYKWVLVGAMHGATVVIDLRTHNSHNIITVYYIYTYVFLFSQLHTNRYKYCIEFH